MKEHLLQTVRAEPIDRRLHLAREYLHLFFLRLLHDDGAMAGLAFVGGTALRILHRLPRFSEDLDFTWEPARARRLEPARLFRSVGTRLERAGYRVTQKSKPGRAVASAFYRFEGLPADCGWTRDPRLALSIRIEIDLRPPRGAGVETTLVQRFFPVAIRHHDLPSLFAGKLHAILARRWAKGRDWFDLVWYLTEKRGIEPNLRLLGNALRQTKHRSQLADGWRAAVRRRVRSLDWRALLFDLRPFVERQSDLDLITPDRIGRLIE